MIILVGCERSRMRSVGVWEIGMAVYKGSIGEARANVPDMPWEDIIGMRHRLVHAYFDMNLEILWRTVQEDLPVLVSLLERGIP